MVSICCASKVLREENFLDRRASIAYPTTVMISIRIIIAWSWNMMSCFIIGDAASWNDSCPHIVI